MSLVNLKSDSADDWLSVRLAEFSKVRQLLDPRTDLGKQKNARQIAIDALKSFGWGYTDDVIDQIKALPTYAPAFTGRTQDKSVFDLTHYIDMQWKDEPKVEYFEPSVLHEMTWINDTDAEGVHTFTSSKETSISNTTTTSGSTTHKWDIEVGYKLTTKESATLFGLTAESTQEISSKVAYGGLISKTTGESKTMTTSRMWSINEQVKIPPRCTVLARFVLLEGTLRGVFTTAAKVMEGKLVFTDVITNETVYLRDEALVAYLSRVQKVTGYMQLVNHVEIIGGFRSEMRTKQNP